MSTSTTEAEYIALGTLLNEVLWTQKLLTELNVDITYPTIIFEDCLPAVHIARGNKSITAAKHIDTKICAIRDYQSKGYIDFQYISTNDQLADVLNKVTNQPRLINRILGEMPQ